MTQIESSELAIVVYYGERVRIGDVIIEIERPVGERKARLFIKAPRDMAIVRQSGMRLAS